LVPRAASKFGCAARGPFFLISFVYLKLLEPIAQEVALPAWFERNGDVSLFR
jgi:hypothetical protein